MLRAMGETALAENRFGHHGRVLFVDLGERSHRVEAVEASVYRGYLGGYGLGAWLMWQMYRHPQAPRKATI